MYSPNYFQASYSSAYAQAYFAAASSSASTAPIPSNNNDNNNNRTPGPQNINRPPPQGQWYSPGSARCDYPKCTFTGSFKALEIHKMDRHLIFPPGYTKNKSKDDWDADASLKGKKVPIMGTTMSLDTPEALEAWIAERKKRWPSKDRVLEKRKRLEEAVERGQLDATVLQGGRNKRRKTGDGQHNERGRGRGRGRGVRGAAPVRGGRGGGITRGHPPAHLPPKPTPAVPDAGSSDEEDDDGPPEVTSSKKPREPTPPPQTVPVPAPTLTPIPVKPAPIKHRVQKQPRPLPFNPFARNDNSLMRNLMMPEIRITVSDLSQAIRFLVDNDFLDGVELSPGEANKRMIEVVGTGT